MSNRYGANIVALAVELDPTLTTGERFALGRLIDAAKHREQRGSTTALEELTASCRFLAAPRQQLAAFAASPQYEWQRDPRGQCAPLSEPMAALADGAASHGLYVRHSLAAKGWIEIVSNGLAGGCGRERAGKVNLRVPSHLIDAAYRERSKLLRSMGRHTLQMLMSARIASAIEQGKSPHGSALEHRTANAALACGTNNQTAPKGHHVSVMQRSEQQLDGTEPHECADGLLNAETAYANDGAPRFSEAAIRAHAELESYWRRIHDRSASGNSLWGDALPERLRHHGTFESCSKCWRAV
jgi:hypothetical protein